MISMYFRQSGTIVDLNDRMYAHAFMNTDVNSGPPGNSKVPAQKLGNMLLSERMK